MEYPGYRDREQIFSYIEECFPYVEKPESEKLMVYSDQEDCVSRYIREHMEDYSDPKLPMDAVRYLHSELNNLRPEAIVWLLPSLLRKAVLSDKYDTLSEFLVNDLESDLDAKYGVRYRYSLLTKVQINCLISVLEYFSEEFGHKVAIAQENVGKLNA